MYLQPRRTDYPVPTKREFFKTCCLCSYPYHWMRWKASECNDQLALGEGTVWSNGPWASPDLSSLVPLCSLIVVSTCTEQAVYISLGYCRVQSICFMNFNSQSSGEILPTSGFRHSTSHHACSNWWIQLVSRFLCLCVCVRVCLCACVFSCKSVQSGRIQGYQWS